MTRLLILSLVGVACTATSLLDIASSLGGAETVLWFTSGVGVVAAVVFGVGALPAVALGSGAAFAIFAGPDWSSGTAQTLLLQGAGFGLAQAAEIALCAGLLTRWLGPHAAPRRSLDGIRWLLTVAFSAYVGSLLVSVALLGVAGSVGAPLVSLSLARVAGVLLIAPLALSWIDVSPPMASQTRPVERLALHLLAAGGALAVFDLLPAGPQSPMLAALMLVFPLLAAWRLGWRDASLVAAYTVAAAYWATQVGVGPLGSYGAVPSVQLLAVFLVVPALTALGMTSPRMTPATAQDGGDTDALDRSVEPELGALDPATVLESQDRVRALQDAHPALLFTLDEDGRILYANRFATEQLGFQFAELRCRHLPDLYLEGQGGVEASKLAECIGNPGQVYRWQGCVLRKDGSPLWVRQSARSLVDPAIGKVILLACDDVTEARVLSRQLARQARHDSLTGLGNRSELENRLREVLGRDDDRSLEHALLYLDIEQLEFIRDACGQSAGDALLRMVAQHLSDAVRHADTPARLGDSEFCVMLEGCGQEQAMRVARAVRAAVADLRFVWENQTFLIGVSIGVVPLNAQSGDVNEVMSAADAACRAAKDQGRNRIHVFRQDDTRLARRRWEMQWVSRITQALEEGRFHLSFQPIVSLQPGAMSERRFELLLRMRDNNGRVVPPSAFLPAAERYNIAVRLDRWVLRKTLAWLQQHPQLLTTATTFGINLCGQSLADPDFLRFADSHLRSSGVAGERICFEITESAAITDLGATTAFVQGMKALGCQFALDNFGSGLSSIGFLKTLPVDMLKIDGEFVKGIVDNPMDRAMVESIHRVGRVTGKQTVAECVENRGVLDKLRGIGVGFAQGYCLGRPEPLHLFDRSNGVLDSDGGLVVG